MYKKISLIILISILFLSVNSPAQAFQKSEILKSQVIEVKSEELTNIPGTNVDNIHQKLDIKILEGVRQGEILEIENDFIKLKEKDRFYLEVIFDSFSEQEIYLVKEVYRLPGIIFFAILFIIAILLFSGKQGLRSLLSLAGSFFIIIYILIPGLLKGYPPILTSSILAALILFIAIFFTHGFNRRSSVAFGGTSIAILLTGILAYLSVTITRLSGFAAEESIHLNFSTGGQLDFSGLLLGSIMIGILGILDDVAITQATIVEEIYDSETKLNQKKVFSKALRVGREHIGALVNTLALAYTGASLPLLLLLSTSGLPFLYIINKEIFATEIIRTIVGSIGLIMTVPLTTFLAVWFLKPQEN